MFIFIFNDWKRMKGVQKRHSLKALFILSPLAVTIPDLELTYSPVISSYKFINDVHQNAVR